jgi:hypothetical protein
VDPQLRQDEQGRGDQQPDVCLEVPQERHLPGSSPGVPLQDREHQQGQPGDEDRHDHPPERQLQLLSREPRAPPEPKEQPAADDREIARFLHVRLTDFAGLRPLHHGGPVFRPGSSHCSIRAGRPAMRALAHHVEETGVEPLRRGSGQAAGQGRVEMSTPQAVCRPSLAPGRFRRPGDLGGQSAGNADGTRTQPARGRGQRPVGTVRVAAGTRLLVPIWSPGGTCRMHKKYAYCYA